MKLEKVSLIPPEGLQELLADLGNGENGFTGTAVAEGKLSVEKYLQNCVDMAAGINLELGFVPQTVFWVIDSGGVAVGIVRIRHYLNDKLRLHGGHIGYFIRSDRRGRGYGREALSLALKELKKLGETRALITIAPDNIPSIKVAEDNGGRFAGVSVDTETGKQINKYWIELTSD